MVTFTECKLHNIDAQIRLSVVNHLLKKTWVNNMYIYDFIYFIVRFKLFVNNCNSY